MRHVPLPGAVTPVAGGVVEATAAAVLVAPACLADRVFAGRFPAAPGAIALTPVAEAANHHLCPAARTEEESARGVHRRPKSRQREVDRDSRLGDTFPAPVPGTVWGATSV